MAINRQTASIASGVGIDCDVARTSDNKDRQIVLLGEPDAAGLSALARVMNANPAESDYGIAVRLIYGEIVSRPLFAKITDGADVLAIDGSGNAMVALGAAMDRANKPTLSDGGADRTVTVNAENNAVTNLLAVMEGKVRTSRAALTNGNAAPTWLTAAAAPVVVESAVDGTPTTGQITVDTTTTNGEIILAANSMRRRAYLHNESATIAVYIGFTATGLTIANGFRLAPGAYLPISHTKIIHGIVASGSAVVSYSEEVVG